MRRSGGSSRQSAETRLGVPVSSLCDLPSCCPANYLLSTLEEEEPPRDSPEKPFSHPMAQNLFAPNPQNADQHPPDALRSDNELRGPARSPTIRWDLPQLSYLHIHRATGTPPLQIPPPATSPGKFPPGDFPPDDICRDPYPFIGRVSQLACIRGRILSPRGGGFEF